jgi:RNA polymerase-binding transcription factor DksA
LASPTVAPIQSALTNGNKVASCPICTECGEPISAKRLAIFPNAEQCVPCLEQSGDIQKIKRYDEYTPNGEVVSTTFTKNRRIEAQMRRVNTMVAPDEAFDIALGDDSHLVRERVTENEHSYSLNTSFAEETVEEEREKLLEAAREHINEQIIEISPKVVPITVGLGY